MFRTKIISVLLIMLVAFVVRAEETKFTWIEDLATAQKLAKMQKKPLLVIFRCNP